MFTLIKQNPQKPETRRKKGGKERRKDPNTEGKNAGHNGRSKEKKEGRQTRKRVTFI